MKGGLRGLALSFALVCVAHTLAFAQGSSTKATLSGIVQDTDGGMVPGATIVVKNVATGVTNTTVSNGSGTFSVPALAAGTYEATVSLSGFKTVKVDKIGLTPGNTSSITVKLDLGAMTETVNVVAHTELIDTTSTTVSATISADQIIKLPLVTKNAMNFMAFLPGVNTPSGNHQQRSSTVMGLPQSAIAIVIDGVNVQDQSVKSTDGFYANIRPQTDLVEQVTVSEGTAMADSSGQGAVQMKFVTRAGTNQVSGSAYEYLRDTALNSNSYFNKVRNLPKNTVNWNQFGFRQGGPIVIPGLYDGRGKAFYFFNYEEFRLPVRASTTRTVLSPQAQLGNFRYGCSTGGCASSVNVLDVALRNGQLASLDPTVAQMFQMMNTAVGQEGSIQQNADLNTFSYSWQPRLFRAEHLPGGRADLNLGTNNRLTATSVFQKANSDPDIVNNGFSSFPGFAVDSTQYSFRYTGTATLRTTLSKNMVNEGGWGTVWSPVYFSSNVTPDLYVGGKNFAWLAVGGNTPSNFNVTANATSRNGSNYNLHDTLTWLQGTHSFSMGGTFTKVSEWDASHSIVQAVALGLDTNNDPAAVAIAGVPNSGNLFTTANFPGATNNELTSARNLYAMLTGRVSGVNGNSILQPDGTYVYRGDPLEKIFQRELGLFVQDQWRLRPNFTVNAGVRYELQYPVQPKDALYARNDIDDLCGRAGRGDAASNAPLATIGCQFGKPGIALTSAAPTYKQYTAGQHGYSVDRNNIAPSVGVAWQPSVDGGFLRSILGDPATATLRAAYGRAFNQGGMSDFLGTLRNGPGLTVNSNRNVGNNNLVLPGDAAAYGGNGWPLLLRQENRFGPPGTCPPGVTLGCIPTGVSYPQAIVFNTGIAAFDPNYQSSFTDSWTIGFQRSLGRDTAIEIRYVGNRTNAIPGNIDYNEQDIFNTSFGPSSSFIDEFQKAQHNLAANIAAGRGATFAYTGAPGTAPLPIFLASYAAAGQGGLNRATDPAAYAGTQWTNTATLGSLSLLTPNIFTFASTGATNGLFGNATFRANGVANGLPANFWVLNPDVATNNLRTAEGGNRYHSLQILANRRLSRGLTLSANYAYQVQLGTTLDTLFRPRAITRSLNTIPHAFKMTSSYELPIGRGRRFLSDANAITNGFLGDWQVNLTGRVETGRLFDIGDIKLVNLSLSDLQKQFKYYVNPADQQVYDLPQDLITNTVKAFAVDATSPTGHPLCTGSNAATCGGPDPSKPYLAPASDAGCTRIFAGDCGVRQQLLKAPVFSRFDFSAKKRLPFAQRASFDVEIDILNVFNAIDFNSVFPTAGNLNNPDNYRVTTAYSDINNTYDPGGRIGQLVFRVNW